MKSKSRYSEESDGLFNDKVEHIDDINTDENFSLDEDDNSSYSDQNNFEAKENYRKLLSGDGDNLDNYQFEDNRSDIKEPADSTSQENKEVKYNIPENDIKVENNGIFYGKDYFEAEDKEDMLFLKELKNNISEKEDDIISKEAIEDNQDYKDDDDYSKELQDTANIENRKLYSDGDENEEVVANNVESKEDFDTMSKEISDESYEKDSQIREIVDNENDTMSKENLGNIEEKYASDSDIDTISKEVIANDQKGSQTSEAVDKDDDTLSKENINFNVGVNAEPVDLVVEDNDEPKEDHDSDSFEDFDNDDLKELRETLDKLSRDSDGGDDTSTYEEYDGKPLKPIKNYEDVDDELSEEEDNGEVENIDSNLGDIFNEAGSADIKDLQDNLVAIKLIAQTSTQEVDIEEEVKPSRESPYGDDAIYHENPNNMITDEDDDNLKSILDEFKDDDNFSLQADDVMARLDTKIESIEYNTQMEDFIAKHKEELDIHSKKFHVSEAPIYKTLSADQAVLITYPDSNPNNNVYDWILDGDGAGVELNITYLNLSGDADQYLLIIPGKYAYFKYFITLF